MISQEDINAKLKALSDLQKAEEKIVLSLMDEVKRVVRVIAKCFDDEMPKYIYFGNADEGEIGTPQIHDNKISIVLENTSAEPYWATASLTYSEEIPVEFLSMNNKEIESAVYGTINKYNNKEIREIFSDLLDLSDSDIKKNIKELTKEQCRQLMTMMNLKACSKSKLCEEIKKTKEVRDILIRERVIKEYEL